MTGARDAAMHYRMNEEEMMKLIEEIAEETGVKPSTVCDYALKNPRYYDKLRRNIEKGKEVREKLNSYRAKWRAAAK